MKSDLSSNNSTTTPTSNSTLLLLPTSHIATTVQYVDIPLVVPVPRDALLLKQMLKKQTGFVLLLKQNKSDLVILHQNQNKSNMF